MTTGIPGEETMRRFRGRIQGALVALAIALCVFSCDWTVGQPEKATIALATPPYTALADIALAKGYFRKHGMEMSPHFHSTGKAALDEVIAGKADFATVAETPVMFAIMNGHKIFIIATIQRSGKSNAVVVRRDRGINTPRDLKGKRIAVTLGTVADYYLDAFLSAHGVARKDVMLVNLPPEKITAALADGQIDAASMFHPFLHHAQQKLGDRQLTFQEADLYTETFNLVATREYIANNPGTVRKTLLGLIDADDFAKREPSEARKAVADLTRTDPAVLAALWEDHVFDVSLEQSLLLFLEDESRWAIKNGFTKAAQVPNYLDHIYFEGLRSARPKALRILR